MTVDDNQAPPTPGARPSVFSLQRLWPLLVVLVASGVVVAMGWHRQLSFETLVRNHEELRDFIAAHEVSAVAAYVVLYIVVVALSVPVAVFLTVVGGLLFGAFLGGAAALVGATIGAIIIFLIVKSLGPDLLAALLALAVRRASGPLGSFLSRASRRGRLLARGLRENTFSYLLFLRLVPIFPFWLVNLVSALCDVRVAPFAAATALGIVPATFAFALFGAGLDSVIAAQHAAYLTCLAVGHAVCRLEFDLGAAMTPKLLAAFAALGMLALVPIAVKRMRARLQVGRGTTDGG